MKAKDHQQLKQLFQMVSIDSVNGQNPRYPLIQSMHGRCSLDLASSVPASHLFQVALARRMTPSNSTTSS
jgi:hypothetical protein